LITGHGGEHASKFLATHFHLKLARHPKFCSQPLTALQETWLQIEDELKEYCTSGDKIMRDGSTATVCLIIAGNIYIANCGDSSGYLQMNDGTISLATEMHNTLNSDEIQRCTAAGGEIRHKDQSRGLLLTLSSLCPSVSCCAPFKVHPTSPELLQPRVYPGGLLVTRSFGDFYAKDPLLGGVPGSVICDPGRVRFFSLGDLRYAVLASDGVWDALEPEVVFKIIGDSLNDHIAHHKLLPSACSGEVLGLRSDRSLSTPDSPLVETPTPLLTSSRVERTSATSTLPSPTRSASKPPPPPSGGDLVSPTLLPLP
jgi:serine/threonine protein phosphatase PrpC